MSRIGRQPIIFPKGVKVDIQDSVISVEGSKGRLSLNIPEDIKIEIEGEKITVKRQRESKRAKSLHGTIRALISNMVKGSSEGFKKELEIIGVGFKAAMKENKLILNIGFSHPVEITPSIELKVSTPAPNRIDIVGIDKQKVGELAAQIRRKYPPEPYKGKGIRYVGEEVRKKLGKALAK